MRKPSARQRDVSGRSAALGLLPYTPIQAWRRSLDASLSTLFCDGIQSASCSRRGCRGVRLVRRRGGRCGCDTLDFRPGGEEAARDSCLPEPAERPAAHSAAWRPLLGGGAAADVERSRPHGRAGALAALAAVSEPRACGAQAVPPVHAASTAATVRLGLREVPAPTARRGREVRTACRAAPGLRARRVTPALRARRVRPALRARWATSVRRARPTRPRGTTCPGSARTPAPPSRLAGNA